MWSRTRPQLSGRRRGVAWLIVTIVVGAGCVTSASSSIEAIDEPTDLVSVVGDEWALAIRARNCELSTCLDAESTLTELRSYWTTGRDEIDADPTLAALDAEWVECMADAGVPVSKRTDLDRRVLNRLEPELSAGERPSAEQFAAADRIQARLERLDALCSAEWIEERNRLMDEFEAGFVIDHRALLERLNATVPQPA